MKTNALIIFIRNPILGKVKTRLAKSIGNEEALAVYHDLLLHTMKETQELGCDKFVFYNENIDLNDIWSNTIYNKRTQFGFDLGSKMQNAFEELFNLGYKKCVIIGSDLFDFEAPHIENAFNKLETNEIVIGPAEDGGYYLLGLKKVIPSVFKNKYWGTSSVFEDTINDLKSYKIAFLETLNDIDTIEDLEKSKYYERQIKNK